MKFGLDLSILAGKPGDRYAGIGAKETPPEICALMTRFARLAAARGMVLRSGAAAGADSAFERGAPEALSEIFVARRSHMRKAGHIPLEDSPMETAAFALSRSLHPAWERCSSVARLLLARNGQQILGRNLDAPVCFALLYTESAAAEGGTGHAMRICATHGIPMFDLGHPAVRAAVEQLVDAGLDPARAAAMPALEISVPMRLRPYMPASVAQPAEAAGSIRVVSKRRERGAVTARPDETVIDVDRGNPVLGNRHVLQDHRDAAARATVVAAHQRDFESDLARGGPMSRAIDDITGRVQAGERIALACWCANASTPRSCHGDLYVAEVSRRLGLACEAVEEPPRLVKAAQASFDF